MVWMNVLRLAFKNKSECQFNNSFGQGKSVAKLMAGYNLHIVKWMCVWPLKAAAFLPLMFATITKNHGIVHNNNNNNNDHQHRHSKRMKKDSSRLLCFIHPFIVIVVSFASPTHSVICTSHDYAL